MQQRVAHCSHPQPPRSFLARRYRSSFSESARDLIRKLLTADKTQRYGA